MNGENRRWRSAGQVEPNRFEERIEAIVVLRKIGGRGSNRFRDSPFGLFLWLSLGWVSMAGSLGTLPEGCA